MVEVNNNIFGVALLSGAVAGLSTDIALFPIDTIKTRLQSADGFIKSGGFRGIYSGVGSIVVASAPGAAVFFCTYEGLKETLSPFVTSPRYTPVIHMIAASVGEFTACIVRVPSEVIKQRAQASPGLSSIHVLKETVKREGIPGLYRGYVSTVMREIPFSFIQFPLWEYFKVVWSKYQQKPVSPFQAGICGSLAGAISAGITTPLDVAKTRIMLAESGTNLADGSITYVLKVIMQEKGVTGLFAGVMPRIAWIAVGGFVFLGMYEKTRHVLIMYKNGR